MPWKQKKNLIGGTTVKYTAHFLGITLLIAPALLMAQFSSTSSNLVAEDAAPSEGFTRVPQPMQNPMIRPTPFSRVAVGVTVSPFGPGLQVTSNISNHLNLRAGGNAFYYSTNFASNGFNATAKLNMASAGVSADIYPFRAGFRISPGVLVMNNNRINAVSLVAGGANFTLNNNTYYSANANSTTGAVPLNASASLGLNTTKPAITLTTGWGNTIPRKGGHWSFPFEVGAAFIGSPSLTAKMTGWACSDQAQTNCADVTSATDPLAVQVQGDLTQQLAKWKNELNALKTYPILSFGMAYSFSARGSRAR